MSGRTYVTDPLLVVEMLSLPTFDNDRGEKLRFYQQLPTMRHILLVYQDQMRAEHYCRRDTGWHMENLTKPDDRVVVEAVRFEITLLDLRQDRRDCRTAAGSLVRRLSEASQRITP